MSKLLVSALGFVLFVTAISSFSSEKYVTKERAIAIASEELKKYYQTKRVHRKVSETTIEKIIVDRYEQEGHWYIHLYSARLNQAPMLQLR